MPFILLVQDEGDRGSEREVLDSDRGRRHRGEAERAMQDAGNTGHHEHTGLMKPMLIVLALIALVLLIIGVAVETLKFLLYVGLVVLVASAALLVLQRVRSRVQR
jgi:Flp pilus assembly protein TadB